MTGGVDRFRDACYGRWTVRGRSRHSHGGASLLARRVSLAASAGAIALLVAGSPIGQKNVSRRSVHAAAAVTFGAGKGIEPEITLVQPRQLGRTRECSASEQAMAAHKRIWRLAQLQLDAANKNLANTTAQLQVVQGQYSTDRGELLRFSSASTNHRGWIGDAILVDSKSFQDAMDALTSADQVSARCSSWSARSKGSATNWTHCTPNRRTTSSGEPARRQPAVALAGEQHTEESSYRQQASSLQGKAASLLSQLHSRAVQDRAGATRAGGGCCGSGCGCWCRAPRTSSATLYRLLRSAPGRRIPVGSVHLVRRFASQCLLERERMAMGVHRSRSGAPGGQDAAGR